MPDFPSRRLHNHRSLHPLQHRKIVFNKQYSELKKDHPYVILYQYRISNNDFHFFFKFVERLREITNTPTSSSYFTFNQHLWENNVTKLLIKWRSHDISPTEVTGNLYIQITFVPTENFVYTYYWGCDLLYYIFHDVLPIPDFVSRPRINRERTAIKEWIKNTCRSQNYLRITPLKFNHLLQLYRKIHLELKDFKLSDLKEFKKQLMNSNVFKLKFRLNRYKL